MLIGDVLIRLLSFALEMPVNFIFIDDWSIFNYTVTLLKIKYMMVMKTKHTVTKEMILDAGHPLIACKGFTRVGLSEILSVAKIPKGSFYHYFESKEQYGCALLDYYFKNYLEKIKQVLEPTAGIQSTAHTRLMNYWQKWLDAQSGCDPKSHCLVVKLSAEVADLSDNMRLVLRDGTEQIMQQISNCIQEGINDKSIYVNDVYSTAQQLYQMWLGACLLAKLHKDCQCLERTLHITLKILTPQTEL